MSDPEGYRFLPHAEDICQCDDCRRRRCTCTAANPCSEDEKTGCPVCDEMDMYEPCPTLGHGCGLGGIVKPGDPWHDSDCCTDGQLATAGRCCSADELVSSTATLPRVPEPRGISDKDRENILAKKAAVEQAQVDYEKAVARALLNGASAPAIQEATGLSPNTTYKYGYKHGWPTAENRANFNKRRYER